MKHQEQIHRALAKEKERKRLLDLIKNGETCGICLEEFEDPVNMSTTLCGHTFHNECMKRLRESQAFRRDPKCPNCRAVLPRRPGDRDLGNSADLMQALFPFMLPGGFPMAVAAAIAEEGFSITGSVGFVDSNPNATNRA